MGGCASCPNGNDTDTDPYNEWLQAADKRKIQKNYLYLRENLMTLDVTLRLVEDGVLSAEDETEIKEKGTQPAKAELFMQKLVHSKPESYTLFLQALQKTGQGFIVDKLENSSTENNIPQLCCESSLRKLKKMLVKKRSRIETELHPNNIVGYFVEQEVFKIENIENILFKPRQEQSKFLFDHILKGLPNAFNVLLYALRQSGSTGLADELEELISGRDTLEQEERSRTRAIRNFSNTTGASSSDIMLRIRFCHRENDISLNERLMDHFNEDENNEVGQLFLKETESVFNGAALGSLILYLTPCSRRSYLRLMKFCRDGGLEILLKRLLSTPRLAQFLPREPVSVQIQLMTRDLREDSKDNGLRRLCRRLIEEFDTVVDEIDPTDFKESFIKRQLLSDEYFHQLDLDFGHSRLARAKDFLKTVLQLGDNAVLAFKETVENKGPEYLLEVLNRDSQTEHDDQDGEIYFAQLEIQKNKSSDNDGLVFYKNEFSFNTQDLTNYSIKSDMEGKTNLMINVDECLQLSDPNMSDDVSPCRLYRSTEFELEGESNPAVSSETMLNVDDPKSRQTTALKQTCNYPRGSNRSHNVSPGISYRSTKPSLPAEPDLAISSDNYLTDQKSGQHSLHPNDILTGSSTSDLRGSKTSDYGSSYKSNEFSLSAEPGPTLSSDNYLTDQKSGQHSLHPNDIPTGSSTSDLRGSKTLYYGSPYKSIEFSLSAETGPTLSSNNYLTDQKPGQHSLHPNDVPTGSSSSGLRGSKTSDYGSSYKSNEFSLSAEPGPTLSSGNYLTDQKSGLQSLHLVPTISTDSNDKYTSSLYVHHDKYAEKLECPRKPETEKRMQTMANVNDPISRQIQFLKSSGKDLRGSCTSDYVSPGSSYKSTEFSFAAEPDPTVSSDNSRTDQMSGLQSLRPFPTIATVYNDTPIGSLHLQHDKFAESFEYSKMPETKTDSNDKPTSSIESGTPHSSLNPRIFVSSFD